MENTKDCNFIDFLKKLDRENLDIIKCLDERRKQNKIDSTIYLLSLKILSECYNNALVKYTKMYN